MQAWHFSESAYPYLPPAESYPSIRVSLASKNYDPKKGAALWDRYLREWQIAEEEGMDIMLNEHHQTATCISSSAAIPLAILARDDIQVDLVITDLVMPGMSGRELAEQIRQLYPATKILCTSGDMMPLDKKAETTHLRKPFTSVELLAKVRRVISANLGVDE